MTAILAGRARRQCRRLLLFIQPDATLLLILVDETAYKDFKHFVATLVEQRIPRLIEALGDLVGSRLLLVDQFGDNAGAAGIDRVADLSRIEIEQSRRHRSQLSNVRDLSGAPDEVAGLQ